MAGFLGAVGDVGLDVVLDTEGLVGIVLAGLQRYG